MDLSRLAASLADHGSDAPLPVEKWNPSHCGSMDLVIRRDGSWWHEGSPITRAPLIRLFSRVLRREDDAYVLVTPAEKIAIEVEDVPFLAVDFDRQDEGYIFRTNVGDRVLIGEDHPIAMRAVPGEDYTAPYIFVRGRLEARVERGAYYRLVETLPEGSGHLVMESDGARFMLDSREGA